jgi:hypothetical protein
MFTDVRDELISPSNIKSGFRATGFYPCHTCAFPSEAFSPDIFTQEPSRDQTVKSHSAFSDGSYTNVVH